MRANKPISFLLLFLISCQSFAAPELQRSAQRTDAPKKLSRVRASSSARRILHQQEQQVAPSSSSSPDSDAYLRVSITPRVSLMRVPVESNAILKCLVSAQAERFARPLDIHWSRYMYDENVYEQIDSFAQQAETQNTSQQQAALIKNHKLLMRRQLPPLTDPSPENELLAISGELQQQQQQTFNRQQQLRDFLARSRQETNQISELLIEATLSINPVKASDNATYYCTANDEESSSSILLEDQSRARIDLIALGRPIVQLVRFQAARDSRSALVIWRLTSDGNTPIKKTILMYRNDTHLHAPVSGESIAAPAGALLVESDRRQWQRIDIPDEGTTLTGTSSLNPSLANNQQLEQATQTQGDVDITFSGHVTQQPARRTFARNRLRAYNLTGLLPGITYQLKLAAINDMGQSDWSQLSALTPSYLPAKITEVYLLSSSNDSLAIGWRRPSYDQAKTIRYEMQLFDLNRTLTSDANTNTSASSMRTNFMYIFVNLNPGTDYHFQVRACSRAGCGPFSSPKLAASTLDGEPDEPLDVELVCSAGGNVSVTWLPPMNTRGQLTNYTLSFESSARYLNSSGRWQVDQWKHSIDTPDNHTLNIEAAGLLLPNTNYSVRICANNRSSQCGRPSAITLHTQCNSAPQLPTSSADWAAGVKLSVDGAATSSELTSSNSRLKGQLSLELPFISQRNGSIDCVQLIIIRLPESFTPQMPLSQFLPEEPANIKLHPSSFRAKNVMSQPEINNTSPKDELTTQISLMEEKAFVYLAEQLKFPIPAKENEKFTSILLGDGIAAGERCQLPNQYLHNDLEKTFKPYDRALRPLTYYTGFLKLMMVRLVQSKQEMRISREASSSGNAELLTSYTNYLDPIRTGDSVLEAQEPGWDDWTDEEDKEGRFENPFRGLNQQMGLGEMASKIGSSLRSNVNHLYSLSSNFIAENARLSSLANFIMRSSPMMQLLEVGLIVLILSLVLLLIVYLISLPGAAKRKQQRKLNRQLQKQQEVAQQVASSAYLSNSQQPASQYLDGFTKNHQQQQQQQQSSLQALVGVSGYQEQIQSPINEKSAEIGEHMSPLAQEHQQQPVAPNYTPHSHQCPIHSSPHQAQPLIQAQTQQQQPVHVCSAKAQLLPEQHNITSYTNHDLAGRQGGHWQDRNCRTLRRPLTSKIEQQQQQQHNELTLSSQMNSVLAFAKKINKSIPLRLFSLVLECRLRNGWLREEYEQLARQQQQQHQISAAGETTGSNSLIRLRSQLIVSKNSEPCVSALISGNEVIDASLIRLTPAGTTTERQYICARSPLDADAVWDFWRLVYEQEVGVIVMLSQNEDPHTNELRCAQYWPTCDNEETTILSPCNEYVQKSIIPPAKFKIRQETLSLSDEAEFGAQHDEEFKLRRLTLMVMATKPSENESQTTTPDFGLNNKSKNYSNQRSANSVAQVEDADKLTSEGVNLEKSKEKQTNDTNYEEEDYDEGGDDESMLIVERTIIHLQYFYWNTSTPANQRRLVKFIETANGRQFSGSNQQERETSIGEDPKKSGPMLVHCFNGLGRSGLFTAMSVVIDELSRKLASYGASTGLLDDNMSGQAVNNQQQMLMMMISNQPVAKINLFHLVLKLRAQRESLLSPYRFYELLYQLTASCIPVHEPLVNLNNQYHNSSTLHSHHHHHHHHHQSYQHQHHHQQQQQPHHLHLHHQHQQKQQQQQQMISP